MLVWLTLADIRKMPYCPCKHINLQKRFVSCKSGGTELKHKVLRRLLKSVQAPGRISPTPGVLFSWFAQTG